MERKRLLLTVKKLARFWSMAKKTGWIADWSYFSIKLRAWLLEMPDKRCLTRVWLAVRRAYHNSNFISTNSPGLDWFLFDSWPGDWRSLIGILSQFRATVLCCKRLCTPCVRWLSCRICSCSSGKFQTFQKKILNKYQKKQKILNMLWNGRNSNQQLWKAEYVQLLII